MHLTRGGGQFRGKGKKRTHKGFKIWRFLSRQLAFAKVEGESKSAVQGAGEGGGFWGRGGGVSKLKEKGVITGSHERYLGEQSGMGKKRIRHASRGEGGEETAHRRWERELSTASVASAGILKKNVGFLKTANGSSSKLEILLQLQTLS